MNDLESCLVRQRALVAAFAGASAEAVYRKIIELGRALPSFSDAFRVEENCVAGCQSILYLHCVKQGDKLFFYADSEALISKGLAALLIEVYSGEIPEAIFKYPPVFLDEILKQGALTMSRSNGLASLVLQMKRQALTHLIERKEA